MPLEKEFVMPNPDSDSPEMLVLLNLVEADFKVLIGKYLLWRHNMGWPPNISDVTFNQKSSLICWLTEFVAGRISFDLDSAVNALQSKTDVAVSDLKELWRAAVAGNYTTLRYAEWMNYTSSVNPELRAYLARFGNVL